MSDADETGKWLWSFNEECFTSGPCSTPEEAIEQAKGEVDPTFHTRIYVAQVRGRWTVERFLIDRLRDVGEDIGSVAFALAGDETSDQIEAWVEDRIDNLHSALRAAIQQFDKENPMPFYELAVPRRFTLEGKELMP